MNYSSVVARIVQLIVVLCFAIYSVSAKTAQYRDDGYYTGSNYFNAQPPQTNLVDLALQRLEHSPVWEKEWPDPSVRLGQVSGLALDGAGRVLVFHRGTNVWDEHTFNSRNVYQKIGERPIPVPTILVFNDTGHLVDSWGKDLFYMPHGITVDHQGNVWVTDVALHQVFKFTPDQREEPALTLGEKFIPGNDDAHFCKPSAVAVMSTGDFFVADGYCNTRILKYSPKGEIILQWGKASGHSNDVFVLNVPHALTLAEDRDAVCVADRERGRAACFRSDNGTYVSGYSSWLMGPRLFSVAYTPARGGLLYCVNGPAGYGSRVRVRGFVLEFASGRLVGTFAPAGDLRNPHDVVVSPDATRVYVAELDPYKVHKFVWEPPKIVQAVEAKPNVTHAKPTAIVETSNPRIEAEGTGTPSWWWGVGSAGGAGAALLLALAALALRAARNQGKRRREKEAQHEALLKS